MTRRTLALSLLIACVFLLTPPVADACICHPPSWTEALAQYDTIVRGYVSASYITEGIRFANVVVSASWIAATDIEITVHSDLSSCGLEFSQGEEYVLALDADTPTPGNFFTSICHPVAVSSQIDAALAELGEPLFEHTPGEDCVIGLGNEYGPTSLLWVPNPYSPVEFHVVVGAEAALTGVSYNLTLEDENGAPTSDFQLNQVSWGPDGIGLSIPSSGGENVGFGGCYPAFGGRYIVAATYSLTWFGTYNSSGHRLRLEPNPDEDPVDPLAATCNDMLLPCNEAFNIVAIGTGVIATETKSFGAVKALYGN